MVNMLNKFFSTHLKSRVFYIVLLIFNYFLFAQNGIAQTNCLAVPVVATFNSKPLILTDTTYSKSGNHKIKFEVLKFYISKVTLKQTNNIVWQENDSFHLIDFDENDSNALCLEIPDDIEFDAIQFNLGIDSLTNVSGALGGDLDPTKGMYWTWQSGYVNFKLQGTSSLCNNPKNEFEFHLGGYLKPFNNLQTIQLMISNPNQFIIAFNLEQFVNQLDLENVNHIMSPSAAAVEHAQLAAKCFSIK